MSQAIYDVIGAGFGPSNLALAIAIAEHNANNADGGLRARFLEKQPVFGWHRGMLIDGARLQVCFMKDLVTLRRPTSKFSFVNYLCEQNRLVDFINHRTLYPSRHDFHCYLEWAAQQFTEQVTYGAEVVGARPVVIGGNIPYLDVVVRQGNEREAILRTRNLVIGIGLEPKMPDGIHRSDVVWHNSELMHRIGSLRHTGPRRFVVVGAGQSAAEVTAYLYDNFPKSEIHAVFARYGYSPSDSTSFANQIFDPAAVDTYYWAPRQVKNSMLAYHSNTNYSVVDEDVIGKLYENAYEARLRSRARLIIHRLSRVSDVIAGVSDVSLAIEDLASGAESNMSADVLICATGYRPASALGLLGLAARLCLTDDEGQLKVERDYRVLTDHEVQCGIYLQGGTEHSHGISSSLLSNVAIRAAEIVQSLKGR